MAPRVNGLLADAPRKALKYGAVTKQPIFVRGGQVFEAAIARSGLNRGTVAGHYGTSESLMSRQIANQDSQHLSFQRICEMPASFLVELIFALIEARVLMRVRRRAILDLDALEAKLAEE